MKDFFSVIALFFRPFFGGTLEEGIKAYEEFDYIKAFKIFEKFANKNNPIAQYYLGKMYEKADFVDKDIDKAIFYYEEASKKNHADAAFALAMIYHRGKGVEKDDERAKDYFDLAIINGNLEAKNMLNLFEDNEIIVTLKDGIDFFNKEQFLQALDVFKVLAKKNDTDALFYIAYICEYFDFEQKPDNIQTFELFLISANAGNKNAQYEMGLQEYYKDNYADAVLWYEKAAKQGLKDAQKNLSTMYELGYGVEKDLKMAKFWLNEYLNNDKEGI